jgi:phosphoribosylanthranilate isomerase
LAGGLGPGNVADAIRAVRPAAVDVSSGLERAPGEKDPALMEALFRAVAGTGEEER